MKRFTGSEKNMGFSLVEVLVAMTVLALVVAPMAALFSSSVRMNMVSKHRMNAITLAEDIMESLKANDIADVCYQFQFPGDFKLIEQDVTTIADESLTPAQVLPKMVDDGLGGTTVAKDSDGNPIFNFKASSSGVYNFSLKDVTVQQNRETYDADIEMSTSKYKVISGAAPRAIDYNSNTLVTISAVKGYENMVAVRPRDEDDVTFANLIAEAVSEGHTGLTDSDIKRTFTIQIDSPESASAGLTYKDSFGYVTKSYTLNTFTAETRKDDTESGEGEGSGEEGVPGGGGGDEGSSGEKIPLENVFLFYTPNYYSKGAASNKDTFEIINNSGSEINVYIVKQESGDYTGFAADESQYRADVKITNSGTSDTYVLTNLMYNLAHDYDDSVAEKITGVTPAGPVYLTVNGAVPPNNKIPFIMKDLADTTAKDRYYDVTIKVYKSSDTAHAEPVYTLTGSTQE